MGSVFAALASFLTPYTVQGSASEYVRTGDQGAGFRFRFCLIPGIGKMSSTSPLPHEF